MRQLLDLYQESAPALAQQQIDLESEFNPQRISLARQGLEQSDPTRFALQNAFNQKVLDDLKLGDKLSDSEIRNAQQSLRIAQNARGNIFGENPAIDEALNTYNIGKQREQQRVANAATALGFGGANNQFASLQGAQGGATAFNAMAPNLPFGVNPNAGAQGAQFAQQNYAGQLQAYNAQLATPNPWLQGLGAIGSIGAGLGGAFIASSEEVKENIVPFEGDGYEIVKNLKVKRYDYKEGWGKKNNIGLIAEETPKPIRVEGTVDMVDLYALMSVIVNAVQKLQHKVERMEVAMYG